MAGRSAMTGPDLQDHLKRYLELRRALGFEMRIEGRLLHDFVAFLQGRTLGEPLASQAALDWACSRGGPRWQTTVRLAAPSSELFAASASAEGLISMAQTCGVCVTALQCAACSTGTVGEWMST